MSLVRFLIALGVGSVLSWTAWILVLTTLDPFSGGFIVIALFYASGALALLGTLTLGGFFLRYWLEKEKIPFQQIAVALRQATTLTAAIMIGLLLQASRLLSGWTLAILIVFTILIELFFLAGHNRHQRTT